MPRTFRPCRWLCAPLFPLCCAVACASHTSSSKPTAEAGGSAGSGGAIQAGGGRIDPDAGTGGSGGANPLWTAGASSIGGSAGESTEAGAASTEGGAASLPATVVSYPGPAGIVVSPDFAVQAQGKPVFVYRARVQNEHLNYPAGKASWEADTATLAAGGTIPDDRYASVAYFDMAGSVTLAITANAAFTGLDIRPRHLGLTTQVSGKTITITLTQPAKFTLDLLGTASPVNTLHVFANALEQDAPKEGDPHVTYYGPGVHEAGNVVLNSGDIIYVAGGAYVRGTFKGSGVDSVQIRGRGIVADNGQLALFYKSTNVSVDGIVILNSSWSINPAGCDGVKIHDVKIINGAPAGDGMDIVQSKNVTIDDCFLRTWDDSIALKGYASVWGLSEDVPVQQVTVTRTIHWNDFGGALVIGGETECNVIQDVTWQNIDIIRKFQGANIGIDSANQAAISNVRYEDIRMDDVALNPYYAGIIQVRLPTGAGSMQGLYFKNIAINTDATEDFRLQSFMTGSDATHAINGVTFDHVSLNGKLWANAADGHLDIGPFVTGVSFVTN